MRTYLVRINLDIKGKKPADTLRFKVAVGVIKSLSKKNNKVVILTHRGRPNGAEKRLSTKPLASMLSKALGKKVIFLPDIDSAKERISKKGGGVIFLLENLRFFPGEIKNSLSFAKKLAELGDVYINNDFATSHRKSASSIAITRFIPSNRGEILASETRELNKIIKSRKRPVVLIVGGAKIRDKGGVIKKFIRDADSILLGGGVANTFMKARGVDIKKSLYEPIMLKKIRHLSKNKKITTPTDNVFEKGAILDIGPKTINEYKKVIKEAGTIIWAGPMGVFEKKKFAKGSTAIARAVLNNKKASTVIGGAETVSSLPIKVDKQKMGNIFFSTGGGAMLHFLSGRKLPALEALKKAKK